ncbi:MAG: hypothetical protein ACREFY_11875 [Acetobacteraceae bacterium]
MNQADHAARGEEELKDQLARLRAQVETLMQERVTPALNAAASGARGAMAAACDEAKALGGHIKEQPVLSVLVAAAVGFVLGRVSR